MANMYTQGLMELVNGDLAWDSSSWKVLLVTSSYTFNADHSHRDEITNEITNTGYTAGGNALTTSAATQDAANDEVEADGTDVTFASLAAGDQPYAAVVYADVGTAATDTLLAYCTLTTPPAPDGNNYIIQWDAEGIFKLTTT